MSIRITFAWLRRSAGSSGALVYRPAWTNRFVRILDRFFQLPPHLVWRRTGRNPIATPQTNNHSNKVRADSHRLLHGFRLVVWLMGICIGLALPFVSLNAADGEIDFAGYTQPSRDAILTTPVTGIIAAIHFHPGDSVQKGDVIMELDKRLEEIEVQRRKIVLQNQEIELKRTRELFERTRGVSEEELQQKEAEHQIAQSDLELAIEQLNRRLIKAPFDGQVADLFDLEPGEGCQVQTPLVRLVDTQTCRLVVNIPARYGHQLVKGETISLSAGLSAEATQRLNGTVTFISPVVDPASGLLKVQIEFDNSKAGIRPGVAGSIRLNRNPNGG